MLPGPVGCSVLRRRADGIPACRRYNAPVTHADTSRWTLRGGCHCGALRIALATTLDPAATVPRACDCSFCRMHGAAWVSDPAGQLEVVAADGTLREYRQGSGTARFLLCARCGVLVAAVFEQDGRRYGVANASGLDARDAFAPAVPASPQQLGRDDKVARWLQLWVPDVELRIAQAEVVAERR